MIVAGIVWVACIAATLRLMVFVKRCDERAQGFTS